MTPKPLAEMSLDELKAERDAAAQAVQAADYQERLSAWSEMKRAAQERLAQAVAEMLRRSEKRLQETSPQPEDDDHPHDCTDCDDDDHDPGEECGRWDNGNLGPHCVLAGTEWCDWDCPYSR